MNTFKILRKPYLSILMASLILFVSCEQYELHLTEKVIDYSLFEEFKKTKIDLSFLSKEKILTYESSLALEQEINAKFGVSLNFPEEWHQSVGLPTEKFLEKSKKYGWIDTQDEEFILEFSDEIQNKGSSVAISNYERNILNMNLTEEELEKKTFFLNVVKSFEYLGVFDNSLKSFNCILAIISITISYINLIFCLSFFTCLLASISYLISAYNLVYNCGEQ